MIYTLYSNVFLQPDRKLERVSLIFLVRFQTQGPVRTAAEFVSLNTAEEKILGSQVASVMPETVCLAPTIIHCLKFLGSWIPQVNA